MSGRLRGVSAGRRRRPSEQQSESVVEQLFWAAYQRTRPVALYGLVQQHETNIQNYRVDFAVPERRIAIEIDGWEYHSDREVFANDRVRQRTLELAGWRFVRFSGRETSNNPDRCVQEASDLVNVFLRVRTTTQRKLSDRSVPLAERSFGRAFLGKCTLDLAVGDLVSHPSYGVGAVTRTDGGLGTIPTATMDFDGVGLVRLMLIGAVPLTKLARA